MREDKAYSRSLGYYAWQRLKNNRLAMFGFSVIGMALLIAILGANIRPDSTRASDDQKLQLARKKPGFEVEMLKKAKNEPITTNWFGGMLFFGGEESAYQTLPVYRYELDGSHIHVEPYTGTNAQFPGKIISYSLADVLFPLAGALELEGQQAVRDRKSVV